MTAASDLPVETRPSRAGRKEWTALAVLALPLLLVSMDVSVLYFAVPFISRDLDPSATQQLWIFDIYGFVLAGLLITMGSIADRIGPRRLLLIGAAAFSLTSVLAAYSGSAEMLIAARAMLGVAGATLMPSTLGLIRRMFRNDKQRAKAIAIWTGVLTGGIALGPVLSGVLLEHFWWGSVFLINVPAMILLLVVGPMLLPEHRSTTAGRFDLVSSVLSLCGVLPIIFGIKKIAADGFELRWIGCIALGLVIGMLFIQRQRRHHDPMIDLRLFRSRGFSASLIANSVGTFALVGNAIFMTQYLQLVLGQSPLVAALWSLVPSIPVGAAAPLATTLAQRIRPAYVVGGGFIIAAVGFVALSSAGTDSLITILIGAGLLAVGLVVVMTLSGVLILSELTPEQASTGSALSETSTEFGGALGIAVLGSIGVAAYKSHIADQIPTGLPADVHAAVSESFQGALAASLHLPGQLAGQVLGAARTAFVDGMTLATTVGAVILVAAAIFTVSALRRIGPQSGDTR
ncbi:DHA2 family multidrug resistance protein-like MFS transporter [Antricoccus suffuscus]|uniref:DHA2 family multidrug resistance protein-like MFS transporter n=1 Tax=Antricoccus suffuscus TaxID=1629062 RepID=A0A2T0Z9A5_9ACTN|nr:MFS transporter [Antricoccus suffuscus]PRZ32744.1 DHA2 family multidrug resistance protein-like MFS transporter [Antricoccus suffuscus]